ncbi:COG1361 S-layer family protein [Acutalibacter muris]|uniref:COG1361 S-layer family protein n=1 Tax=Acutalibacter muris TaxID=1796620 RepID=UPI00272ED2D4|nr:hypothetical protein [Acutalibacter muris]
MRYIFAFIMAVLLVFAPGVLALTEEGEDLQPDSAAEPSPEPTAKEQTLLYIDNRSLYEHMDRTYSQGYRPTVKGGAATVVLPLLCRGELRDNSLRARAVFDPGGPFAAKNYEQTVELKEHKVNGGKQKTAGYCAIFTLELEKDRLNGSYPVTINVSGTDIHGAEIQQDFTLFVSITDGKDPNATPAPEPAPTPEPEPPVVLGPKVLIESCTAISLEEDGEPGTVNAGDRVRVTVTLVNTSGSQGLENMAVTAASPGEGFSLLSPSESVYVGDLAAGGRTQVVYDYQVSPETAAGQYAIPISYDFAYNKGETGSGSGSARVNISQPLEMEFSLGRMPGEAVVSDVIEVNIQAINLSHAKAYNVRAAIEGDGLLPSGTAFIGDLEGGAMGEKPLEITITGLTESETPYGPTGGTVTYLYEDRDGAEFTQTGSFTLDVKSPFSENTPADEKEDPGQFWIVLGAVGAAVLGLLGALIWKGARRRKA